MQNHINHFNGVVKKRLFLHTKKALSSPPVLGYANCQLPFEVHTGDSQKALGAILYQNQGGLQRVNSYASRG